MALRQRQRLLVEDGAERLGPAGRPDRLEHEAAVALAAGAVHDHAGDAQRGIEGLEAAHHRGGAPRLGPGVEDQHDGRAEPLRDLRRRPLVTRGLEAVEAAHDALDDDDVGARRVSRDALEDALAAAHPAVEVVRRAPAGARVEARVDEVGADLERLDREAAAAERLEQPERDRRLPDPGRHPRDDERAHGHPCRSGD